MIMCLKFKLNMLHTQMRSFLMLVIIIMITGTTTQKPPISFLTSHSPHAYLIKAEVQPNTQFKLYSLKLRPSGNHWTTVDSNSDKLSFIPSLDSQSLLFNEKHKGTYHMAYYGKTANLDSKKHFHHHFTPAVVIAGETTSTFLLPLFTQDLPSMSTSALYRCSNSLLWVEWDNNDAQMTIFSKHDPWSIRQSIDNGFVNSERQIHYGKFIDEGHIHPIRIDIAEGKYCQISQDTPAASIEIDPNQEFYDLETILSLVGQSLPIKGVTAEEL